MDLAVDDGCKDRVLELCALEDAEDAREYLEKKTLPEFPVRGQDLLDAGMEAGPEMGVLLAKLKRFWKSNAYKPSREELLEGLDL